MKIYESLFESSFRIYLLVIIFLCNLCFFFYSLFSESQFKKNPKTTKHTKCYVNFSLYAPLLRYTSTEAYKHLLEQFPLLSLSLLKKLNKDGMEPQVLLNQGKIRVVVYLLLDKRYLQKNAQYQIG